MGSANDCYAIHGTMLMGLASCYILVRPGVKCGGHMDGFRVEFESARKMALPRFQWWQGVPAAQQTGKKPGRCFWLQAQRDCLVGMNAAAGRGEGAGAGDVDPEFALCYLDADGSEHPRVTRLRGRLPHKSRPVPAIT